MPRRSDVTIAVLPKPLDHWLVRRIRRNNGQMLSKPSLWGKVPAASAEAAIVRFITLTNCSFNPKHFDAIPFTFGGTSAQ